MARYGQQFKDKAVARLLPPESASPEVVSRELGVGVATLERWRSDALSMPARGRAWTAAARLDAVITTAAMDDSARSAWCRGNGVYPQALANWHTAATQALAAPEEARASPMATRQDRRRIKDLERELRRKDRALAETAALLVLSKRVAAIFSKGEDTAVLAARHRVYTDAKARNPARWSRHTRNWTPISAVTLNPERDSVIGSSSGDSSTRQDTA